MKSKTTFGRKFAIELSASGVFVLGVLWFGIYWLVYKTIPTPSLEFNLTIPFYLMLFGGLGGTAKAWYNQIKRAL